MRTVETTSSFARKKFKIGIESTRHMYIYFQISCLGHCVAFIFFAAHSRLVKNKF